MKNISLLASILLYAAYPVFVASARDASDPVGDEALRLVDSHNLVITGPPKFVPTETMTDGPVLGNGDAAVVMAGPPEELRFHIGKNDFWGRTNPGQTLTPEELAAGVTKYAHTKGGGRLTISIPALKGASYRLEQSLKEAEVRGTFTKGALTVRTHTRVDANRNLLVTELSAEGGEAEVTLNQAIAGQGDAEIRDSGKPAQIGREQAGGGRWYFQGELAGVSVSTQPLTPESVRRAAATPPASGERFDGKSTWRTLETPQVGETVAVSAWIKPDAGIQDNGVYYILSKGDWSEAYSLGFTTNRRLRWSVNGRFIESKPIKAGEWHHVAAISKAGGMTLYLDGEPVGNLRSTGRVRNKNGILCGYRDGDPYPSARRIAWATRMLGETKDSGSRATLVPGRPLVIVTAISSDLDAIDPEAAAEAQVHALTPAALAGYADAHRSWWAGFWRKSFIEIPDKVIERHWYTALYSLASCCRDGRIPPGLWGWATADISAWCGSYTLNYNYEAPFFIAGTSNHPELMHAGFKPVVDFIPKSRELAKSRGFKGIYFPTGIAPWGWNYGSNVFPADADFGQRSNASYLAVNFISYWNLTRDEKTLRDTIYPFLRGVGEFWEDYLKTEGDRYVILHDAIHEEGYQSPVPPISADKNSILSLALVKQLFGALIPMSETLGVDANKRAKWNDIVARMSLFSTQQRDGKTVFRYTEEGRAWNDGNTLGIQHIYPGNGIGLGSDPKLLEISRNTIAAMGRWGDGNGTSTWYSACARVGYDPATVLAKLRHECDTKSGGNGILRYGGGGIENLGTLAAVNEMLMQSHEGVIRFFPSWPKDKDARFGTLRACGAFLVSAQLQGGEVQGVMITSEKGRDCAIINPWPGGKVLVKRDGKAAETVAGERFTLKTKAGEKLELYPL